MQLQLSSQSGNTPHQRIRVLVVDDHAAARHAMATCVAATDDMELLGEASSGEEALRLCAGSRPDVVLMAIVMPGMSGADTTRAISTRWPPIRVLGMSTFQEEDLVQELLRAGAVGYMLKNVSAEDLAGGIRSAWYRASPESEVRATLISQR
jgi:NarL family two-component system response regulator LiaR